MMKSTTKNNYKNLFVIFFWLVVWQLISMIFKEEILFVSPFKVFMTTFENLKEYEFYKSIFSTLYKILIGFSFGTVIGIVFAIISYNFKVFKELIYIPMLAIKSIPVVSFIVLLLFFVDSKNLSIYISFIMVLPIIYLNVYKGLYNVDRNLLNMAVIYRVNNKKKIKYIYIDAVKPFLESAMTISIGLAFKSGIAAEVIGLPKFGVGTMIYNSKVYLDTANLFSYTIVAVVLSFICEKLILKLLRRFVF